ncbi:MAG: DUF1385 domain-containing protein [Cytophagales bacterium]|nr:DUF1385 domain-containing protein [Armatimonadota bacterium]
MAETLYGGQAVIEGVMMRGTQQFAVACRRESGEIAVTCEAVPKVFRPAWQKLPFLRGAFSLVDAMTLGTKAMFWAAKIAEADIPKAEGKNAIRRAEEIAGPALGTAVAASDPTPAGAPAGAPGVTDVAIGGAMVTGLLFAMVLVFVIPNLVLSAVQAAGVTKTWQLGLIDAAVRFGIFFTYIAAISQMKHVRRVFQYHGAEHKSINALEAGGRENLTVAAARAASRLHPRCGTSFVFIVLLLSTLALAPFYGLPTYIRVPIHLLLALPIAGVSFELLRLAGKYRSNPIAAALSRPGMFAQLLTTREPDDAQLAVAITSLETVMDAERAEQAAAENLGGSREPVATVA